MAGELRELLDEFAQSPKADMDYNGPTMLEWLEVREIDKEELDSIMTSFLTVAMFRIGQGGLSAIVGAAFRLGYEAAMKKHMSGRPGGP